MKSDDQMGKLFACKNAIFNKISKLQWATPGGLFLYMNGEEDPDHF